MIKILYLTIFIFATTIAQAQVSEPQIDDTELELIEIDETVEIICGFPEISRFPLYPGCERLKTRKDQQKCFANQISQFIHTEFSQKFTQNRKLPEGKIRIQTLFYIDSNGKPAKIRVKGPTPELEKEAIRVISRLPQMKPALQRRRPVEYPVSIPILIENKWK